MAKFKFSLEALLRQREWAEKERQRVVSEVLGRMAALEGELQALDLAVKASAEDLRGGRLVGTVDLAFLAAHRRFVQASERKAGEVIQKMREVTKELEVARHSLMEAAKARKVVEKLRERKLAEWKDAQAKAEQQEMDDVGMKLTISGWREEAATREEASAEEEALPDPLELKDE
jgi:flagellar protein FliJ